MQGQEELKLNIKYAYLFLLVSHLFMVQCNPAEIRQTSTVKPNIVILFCDDLGYGDLGSFGHPTIRTPNLDKMAAEGMKFTNFYSGSPACTASRYAMLTGRYPIRSGFDWVLYPNSKRGIHPDEITLAEALKQSGYQTACYGKWHLGNTKNEYLPLQNGFDEYLGLPYSNDMLPPKWSPIPLIEGNDTLEMSPDQSLLTVAYTQRATDFIRRNKENPFFLYLPYTMPHIPLHPGSEFAGKSARGIYGDVVEEIDWSTGEILNTIREEGLSEKTLVFFTSDNGPWIIKETLGGSSGLLRDGKGSTWEGGMRVPAIAWWPETVDSGTVQLIRGSTLDLFATALQLGGVDLPKDRTIDGHGILHLLKDDKTRKDDDTPFFYYGPKEVHAVRKGPWKLHLKTSSQTKHEYFNGKVPLLFNLDADPSEQYDLSEKHPHVVLDLMNIIEQHVKEVNNEPSFFSDD